MFRVLKAAPDAICGTTRRRRGDSVGGRVAPQICFSKPPVKDNEVDSLKHLVSPTVSRNHSLRIPTSILLDTNGRKELASSGIRDGAPTWEARGRLSSCYSVVVVPSVVFLFALRQQPKIENDRYVFTCIAGVLDRP